MSPLFEALPADIMIAEHEGDLPGELFPGELREVKGATPGRRREFTTVRVLAREAVECLGVRPLPLVLAPVADGRSLTWPNGVVGSLSHCSRRRVAAAALKDPYQALGVDVEDAPALPDGAAAWLLGDTEEARLRTLPRGPGAPPWEVVTFSAKESLYKACSALGQPWVDPKAWVIEIDAKTNQFAVYPLGPCVMPPDTAIRGWWCATADVVATLVVVYDVRSSHAPGR